MGLRSRLARWLAPDPFTLLSRYENTIEPRLLQLFEDARSGGGFERVAPVDVTPELSTRMGLAPLRGPSQEVLATNVFSTADFAIRAICDRMSELQPELCVRRNVGGGTVEDELVDTHPLVTAIQDPHPDFTTGQLLSLSTRQVLSTGESYWLKIRNGFALPRYLQVLAPGALKPVVERGITTSYVLQDARGQLITIEPRDVLRFWMPDAMELYTAKGPLAPNWTNHKASVYAEQYLAGFYEHDATPPVYLQGREGAVAPTDAAREAFIQLWIAKHHRRLGTHRGGPAFIPPLWEVNALEAQKGSEIVPLLEWWMRHTLMHFGVPRSVRGEVVSGDRSSAETNQYVFDRHSIAPIAKLFSDTLTRGLAREIDDRLHFRFAGFIDADKEYELRREASDIVNKIRSPQQILRDRGSDIEDAPWGIYPPGSIADTPYTGEEREIEPEEGDADDQGMEDMGEMDDGGEEAKRSRIRSAIAWRAPWERSLARAARRVFSAQERDLIDALQTLTTSSAFEARIDALRDLWTRWFGSVQAAIYERAARNAYKSLRHEDGFEVGPGDRERMRRFTAQLAANADATTKRRLREAFTQARAQSATERAAAVRSAFRLRIAQATTIARTETLRAAEAGKLSGLEASGVHVMKHWVCDGESGRHAGIDPDTVGLRDLFTLSSGRKALHPGDPNLPAEDVINCRCTLLAVK